MPKQYLLMTLDPVHIGTGGYRLGRVDNSIAREPGTKLPKIPGTSLNGAIRTYAAYVYEEVTCAGQKNHCGEPTCPICYTFGSVSGEDENQKARAGTVNIFDAQILFFPVWSMMGPIWITTKNILDRFDVEILNFSEIDNNHFTSTFERNEALNFGWLMLESKNDGKKVDLSFPSNFNDKIAEYEIIKDKIAIVSDRMFSQIVNDNLEVRTSVSINPETGAAEKGALFTYEAIPRSTFLMLEVVEDDFFESFPSKLFLVDNLKKLDEKIESSTSEDNKEKLTDKRTEYQNALNKLESLPIKDNWNSPTDVFESGLSNIEFFGVGGMGTRGFGRLRWINVKEENSSTVEKEKENENV